MFEHLNQRKQTWKALRQERAAEFESHVERRGYEPLRDREPSTWRARRRMHSLGRSYTVFWKAAAEVEFCRPPGHTECRKPGSIVGQSWFLEKKNGQLVVSHGGGDDGFITAFTLIPGRDFAVVMMTNSDRARLSALRAVEPWRLRSQTRILNDVY